MGKFIYYKGARKYKHEVIPLLMRGLLTLDDLRYNLRGWKMFDKPGWSNNKIINAKIIEI
jgi:hypothetical protein